MKFGIFSNSRRPYRSQAETWKEDLFEVALADELGLEEAWISEHTSPAELLICKASAMTSRIRLGSAVRPLAYHHPLQVAIEAVACDNLTDGRYKLGIGTGFGGPWMVQRGLEDAKRRDMTHAALELILRLFTANGEPFDYDGPYWHGKGLFLRQAPLTKPYPPMAIAAGQNLGTVQLAGEHGFQVLTGDFNPPHRLRTFGATLDEAWKGEGQSRDKFSVTRVIYVADSDGDAIEDMRESYNQTIAWEVANTPWHQIERVPPGGTLEDITYDYLVETRNLFIGSPDTVYDCIKELYDHVGGFGLLMFHAGRDYATREKRERSMRLFMQEVAPRLRELDAARQGKVAVAA